MRPTNRPSRRAAGRKAVFLYSLEITTSSPDLEAYTGSLRIWITTPGQPDGTVLTMIHCLNGEPQVRELIVVEGGVGFEVNMLSNLALFGKKQASGSTSSPGGTVYELTVENGTGGGWYRDGEKAELKAVAPVEGAKFLRWELDDGYGDFADPTSLETEFTMNIGDAVVKAVFELPTAPEIPSESPQTGDRGLPIALPLLAAGAALSGFVSFRLRRRKQWSQRKNPAGVS